MPQPSPASVLCAEVQERGQIWSLDMVISFLLLPAAMQSTGKLHVCCS